MSISELSMTLEDLTRTCPQASDPRVRVVLASLLPHARELFRTQSDSATAYFLRIGSSLTRLRGAANSAIRLALLHDCCHHLCLTGSTSASVSLGEFGLELARRSGRQGDVRRFLSFLGVASAELGDRGRGLEFHTNALVLATSLQDRHGQYVSWSNLSAVLVDSGLYSEATECASRALHTVSPHDADADDKRARVLNNTALALLLLGDVEQAEACASRAIALSSDPASHQDAVLRLVRELNMVMALVANKKFAMARSHSQYMSGLAARFQSPRNIGIARMCEGLTEVYIGDATRGLCRCRGNSCRL